MFRRLPTLALGALLLASTPLLAAQPVTTLTVLSSGGIMGAIREVAPAYEKATGVKLDIAAAPSMGDTPQA
ncbi:ABC transporter substrate-binding protein, partial [Pseudomonas oryzihabitans]|nr:ABC transporter substrate-binding protein [Pseudomonas oryzihabitans]